MAGALRSWTFPLLVALAIPVLCTIDGNAAPALPGAPCAQDPPPTARSETEKWVWGRVCIGQVANINEKLGKAADPKKPKEWGPERRLSPAFLETILLHEPWRSAIPHRGVVIIGALFDEPVNLEDADIVHAIGLARSRFTSDVQLQRIRTRSALLLANVVITGTLDMDSASIGGHLLMRAGAEFAEVILRGVQIEGQLDLSGANVAGTLNLESARIGGDLYMLEGADLTEVILRSANVHGSLDLSGAEVDGRLNMNSANIGGSLLTDGAKLADVDLRGAQIGNQLSLMGVKSAGTLNMDSVSIGDDLFMGEGAEFAEVILRGAQIGSQLSLIGARIGTLDMDSARIGGSLLSNGAEFAKLILHSARIADQLSLIGAKVSGTLIMEAVDIGGSLIMRQSKLTDVDLRGANIGQVDATGAKVSGTLIMNTTSIDGSLYMREGAEFAEVILRGAQIGGQLDATGATFAGRLNLDSASIGGDLFMREGAGFADVILRGARIEGQFVLSGAKITGTLNMNAASIGGSLLILEGAEVTEVDLRAAQIGGQVALAGTKIIRTLDMDSAGINGSLLSDRAEFSDVILHGARIRDQLRLDGVKVTGRLDIASASIGADLLMREGQFSQEIDLVFAKIGGGLDLRGSTLARLDLTGAQVDGALYLGSGGWRPTWSDGASLVLRNARAAALQAEPQAWPQHLDLHGFNYERFDGAPRGSRWFLEWLGKDPSDSLQPYEQLGRVLRQMDYDEEADDILYVERERARHRAWQDGHLASWLRETLFRWATFGYGYRPVRTIYWVVGLVLIGTIVLGITGQNQRDDGKMIGIWYSFDTLLPIIELRKAHYDIDLEGFARYYFYFHKLMGYVLASFLIAGLTGLTK